MKCRCGWVGAGAHPCHGYAYTCGKPSRSRFYEPHKLYSLAGAQPKRSMVETHACDECWAKFTKETR